MTGAGTSGVMLAGAMSAVCCVIASTTAPPSSGGVLVRSCGAPSKVPVLLTRQHAVLVRLAFLQAAQCRGERDRGPALAESRHGYGHAPGRRDVFRERGFFEGFSGDVLHLAPVTPWLLGFSCASIVSAVRFRTDEPFAFDGRLQRG